METLSYDLRSLKDLAVVSGKTRIPNLASTNYLLKALFCGGCCALSAWNLVHKKKEVYTFSCLGLAQGKQTHIGPSIDSGILLGALEEA